MNVLTEPHKTRLETLFETVGVIGLGYVGYPLALLLSEAFGVVGFDIDEQKIRKLSSGESYISHIPQSLLDRAIERKALSATGDFARIAECDAVVICVPTPLGKNLEPDLSYIENTCRAIAPYLKPNTLVSLESTTWPGTTIEVVRPILETSGLIVGKNLFLAYSPEREDPGNRRFRTKNIPKLIGADDQTSLDLALALYSSIVETVVPVSGTKVAESSKLLENIFRSVNIALVNELKIIFEKMGIDIWEVIDAASTKPFGFTPFYPGPGLGGHCIPIDPFYLAWKAKEVGITTRFIELAGEINRAMPSYVVQKIAECLNQFSRCVRGSKILILGIAYKPDIDDMRESPSLKIMELLEEMGAEVDYHDPYFPEIGKTRAYPFLEGKSSSPLSEEYDCMVLATAHSSFSPEEILSFQRPVIDTRNFLPRGPFVYPA